MMTSTYAAETQSRSTHNAYIAQSNAYRQIREARRAGRTTDWSRYRLLERLGARLIAIGRVLCERRGNVAVEVAFHAGGRSGSHTPDGRHVA